MRTLFHEFESLEHLLSTRLLPGGDDLPIRFVIFGGTGAVGGASVLELVRLISMLNLRKDTKLRGEIHATGLTDKEVAKFVHRLYLALEDFQIDKIQPLRHYRIGGLIDLHFELFKLQVSANLVTHTEAEVEKRGTIALEPILEEFFAASKCPFQAFVEGLGGGLLHAVLVGIPLPSVAAYTLTSLDGLLTRFGRDTATSQRLKKLYLQTFVRGLAVIQQCHARHVLMAHTTGVGGMYRVDGGSAAIRLGFAHSGLDKQLANKKHFAEELTQLYLDHGFDVLVTAAAIGIDAVELRTHLPSSQHVMAQLRTTASQVNHELFREHDLESGSILLYPALDLPLNPAPDEPSEALVFGNGKELIVGAAIRSGENGLFSVANCVALYHVMKVAIPEELATVLVRRAVFGEERRRDWFDNKICHYHETENAYFALRLLDSYPELTRAHFGPFSVQAFQALGSATHQARLHELGILMLLLRLRELRGRFEEIPEAGLHDALNHLDDFLWKHTRIPAFTDLEGLTAEGLAAELALLCEARDTETAGRLLGYEPRRHGLRERAREELLHRLSTQIYRYLETITSLGIPIVYRRANGQDRVLSGPFVAPLDRAVASSHGLAELFGAEARKSETSAETWRDWTIVNNGFVDLRPLALASAAKEAGTRLADQVKLCSDRPSLIAWLAGLEPGSYFTTGGLVALLYRLERLGHKLSRRRLELGTRETWKHLFQQDLDGRILLTPGLIETARMYSEGLGKVTGTEALWPAWGY